MSRKRINTLPDIPREAGSLRRWMQAVQEALEVRLGRRGDPGEEAVTFNDLIDMKIITGVSKFNPSFLPEFEGGIPPIPGGGVLPSTPPPKPSGFTASGTFNGIFLDWDLQPSRPDITLTEVRRSQTNDFSTALPIGSINGSNYFDIILGNQAQTFFYWIRHVSANGLVGAWSDVASATTEPDVDYLLTTLSNAISEGELATSLEERIDLIDGSEALPGSVNARIANEATLREDADTALAQDITTVQTNLGDDIASVQQSLTSRISNLLNLIPNGSFITGDFSNWTPPAVITTNVVARDDTHVTNAIATMPARFAMQWADEGHGSVETLMVDELFDVTEGLNFTMKFSYAGGGTGIDVDVQMFVRWFDDTGAFVSDSPVLTATANSVSWEETEAAIVSVPVGASQAQVWFQRLTGGNGQLYITNLTAQRADAVLETMFTVKLDVNGYVAGFGLFNDGSASQAVWRVDTFAIGSPGNPDFFPFILDSGIVYIDQARIQDGSIQTAKIGDATITTAKIADASIVNAKISNGTIQTAKIADAAITNAKVANAAIGNANIQNGAISNAKIQNAAIDTAKIASAAITTAKIQDASVQTLKIAGNAVTVPAAVFHSGSTSLGDSENWINVAAVSLAPQGGNVVLISTTSFFASGSTSASTSFASVNVSGRLTLDNTSVIGGERSLGGETAQDNSVSTSGSGTISYRTGGLGGTRTFALQLRVTSNLNPSGSAQSRFILAMSVKR